MWTQKLCQSEATGFLRVLLFISGTQWPSQSTGMWDDCSASLSVWPVILKWRGPSANWAGSSQEPQH
jgi:hypothetical protein